MSKSTTTHRAAIKALSSLLVVTVDLEARLAALGEAGVFDYDPDRGANIHRLLKHAGHVMTQAERVIGDTAAVSPADRYTAAKQAKQEAKQALKQAVELAPVKGKAYRVKCICDQTTEVVADSVEDAIHRVMCGEGNLVDTDTHDFDVTRLRKKA